MTVIKYFFIGFITAIIGALPLGATNIAVINTTVKENTVNALKIVYPAALAELILVLFAINFNMQIEEFISLNIWLQYAIAIILLTVGFVFIFKQKTHNTNKSKNILFLKSHFKCPKQVLGFILGLVNPTVLIYWILVISFLNNNVIFLNTNIELIILVVFFSGVYVGKALTLFGYIKFSNLLEVKSKNITENLNHVIGVLLILVSVVQFTKLLFY